MKKILRLLMMAAMLLLLAVPAFAGNGEMTFAYELSVDGTDEILVETGDTVTLMLRLRRTDGTESYDMHAMQAEIHYDEEMLQLVEGSANVSTGIMTQELELTDGYREFYMNYLSMSGGNTWESDALIGTVQFRVIGTGGVTKITNEDALVSLPDGSGSYACSTNEVTLILSTECTVRFMTNGGSEVEDQVVQYGELITAPPDPIREGYTFVGWYSDIDLTEPWDFAQDKVQGNMTLYAKWEQGVPEETLPEQGESGIPVLTILLILLFILLVLILLLLCRRRRKHKKRKK